MSTLRSKNAVVILCVLLAVVSSLLYINTLGNDYAMDDVTMITQNRYVQQGLAGIPTIFTSPHMQGFQANLPMDDYRPLSVATFALEYQFFGLSPLVGHFINVVLFSCCVVLLFLFLFKLQRNVTVAFIAAMLFAVHPIHTEVVANIKSRDELLCLFFAFLALYQFLIYSERGRLYTLVMGAVFLFLSVLSKETVAVFIFIIPLVFLFYANEHKARSRAIIASVGVVFAMFIFISFVVMSNGAPNARLANTLWNSPGSMADKLQLLAADMRMLGAYIRLLLVPHPLIFNYSANLFAATGYGVGLALLSCGVYLLLLVIGVVRLYRYKKDPWALGILFYLACIAMFSNIPFLPGQAFAERYAFMASVGFCYLVALAANRLLLGNDEISDVLLSNKKALWLLPVLLCFSVMTIARNRDWKNNDTLLAADLPKAPNDPQVQYMAGLALRLQCKKEADSSRRAQLNEQGIHYFLHALEIAPGHLEANLEAGNAYFDENVPDKAEQYFKKVLQLNSRHLRANENLATLYFRSGNLEGAIAGYRTTIAIDAREALAWYNMGICYAWTGQNDSSIACNKKVIALSPEYDEYKAFGNVAILYKLTGQMDSATKYEGLTKVYFPDFHL